MAIEREGGTTSQERKMDIRLGSNVFRNTNGVLTIHGKEQIVLEMDAKSNRLLLTMDLYNAKGAQVAHLRRNSWALNDKERFELSASPSARSLVAKPVWLTLTDAETNEVVLEVRIVDHVHAHILKAHFYTHKGQRVEITPHVCRITSGITMFGEAVDLRGEAAAIG